MQQNCPTNLYKFYAASLGIHAMLSHAHTHTYSVLTFAVYKKNLPNNLHKSNKN